MDLCRIIAHRFRWNFEGSRNLIRTDCGISRGDEIRRVVASRGWPIQEEKKKNEKMKKSGYIRICARLANKNGYDKRHSSSKNLLKIISRFACTRCDRLSSEHFARNWNIHRLCREFIFTLSRYFPILLVISFDVRKYNTIPLRMWEKKKLWLFIFLFMYICVSSMKETRVREKHEK